MSLDQRACGARVLTPPEPDTAPPPQIAIAVAGLVVAGIVGSVILARSGSVPAILFGLGLALVSEIATRHGGNPEAIEDGRNGGQAHCRLPGRGAVMVAEPAAGAKGWARPAHD